MNNTLLNRNSNYELLRIIAMLLIITTHIFGHYIHCQGSIYPFPRGYVFYYSMKSVSYVAVNIYVMISAFFLCDKEFKSKRIINTYLQVLFYSVLIFLVFSVLSCRPFSIKETLSVFFPFTMSEYWFATIYIGLLCLSPFLNIWINAMNEVQLKKLTIILLILFCILPSFIGPISRWLSFGGSCGIMWFMCLYVFTAYIKKYIVNNVEKFNRKWFLWGGVFLGFLPAILRFLIVYFTYKIFNKPIGGGYFYNYNDIFIVASCFFLFLYFARVEFKSVKVNRTINFIAKSCFGVYLIHDNPFIREVLADYIPQIICMNSCLFPLQYLAVTISIFAICSILDLFRRVVFIPIEKLKVYNKIDKKLKIQ